MADSTPLPPVIIDEPPTGSNPPGTDPGTGGNTGTTPGTGGGLTTGTGSLTSVPVTQPAGVQKTYGQSSYYLVVIYSSVYGFVEAWLPDELMLNVSSNWGYIVSQIENPLANWVAGAAELALTGNPGSLKSQYLSNMAWRGSSPLQLQLPLHFFAESDANLEVIEPIKRVIKMALPRRGGTAGTLIPPGPFAFSGGITEAIDAVRTRVGLGALNTAGAFDHITIYIGNYLRMTEVFISNISSITFPPKLSKEGYPMEGRIVFNISTLMAPVAQDIDHILGTFSPEFPQLPVIPVGSS